MDISKRRVVENDVIYGLLLVIWKLNLAKSIGISSRMKDGKQFGCLTVEGEEFRHWSDK